MSMAVIDEPRVTFLDDNYLANLPPVPEEPPPEPKKKKKKKLTKAERKERKLQAEIEFKKLELRSHLTRELELSKRSAKRGRATWEDMCREIKIIEFRQELQTWDAKTERVLQQKDDKITMLLGDMDTTQEMHRRHFTRQLQAMDYIINSYKTMLDSTRSLYELQTADIIRDFQEELYGKEDTEGVIKNNCENIMHATNLIVEQQMQRDYQIYLVKRDDVVNTEIAERYHLRDEVVAKMKKLRQQLVNFVYALQSASLEKDKYERIRMLMERQRNFVVESQKLNDLEYANTRTLAELQRDLLHIEVEAQRRLNDLRLEHAYFMHVRKAIEHNMELDRQITFEKLMILCRECYDIVKTFKRMEKSGELLLCLAATCRKLQTESEKVVPWGDFQDPKHLKGNKELPAKDQKDSLGKDKESEYFKLQVLDLKAHFDLSERELVDQMQLMQNFWRRQALVEAQNLLLKEEKASLTAENEKYINFIKSMSKTDKVDELLAAVTVQCVLPEGEQPCLQKYRLVRRLAK